MRTRSARSHLLLWEESGCRWRSGKLGERAARRCCRRGEEEVSKPPLPEYPAALEVVQMWIRTWWRSFGSFLPAATK